MLNIILRLFVTILALLLTDYFLANFNLHGGWVQLLWFGIVIGLLNWLIKPVLVFFSFPLIILTIGLFYFVINALVLYIATLIMPGVLTATMPGILFGSILMSFFHWLLSIIFRVRKQDED
ncbi:MAG TPA: phage holin family protein [Acidobacteriota bacterium]|jgi:putative membrane protein|nr:phage holin family protein [Acidobacteriota bacterium]